MPERGRLYGKVALVTGGAGGLGYAIAERFAQEGATACLADLDEAAAEEQARKLGAQAFGVRLDVTDEGSVEAAAATVMQRAGRIDILVNSAGLFGLEPWLKLTRASFERIFAVNVMGLAFVTQAVAARMVPNGGGSIVNIASAAGRSGNPQSVAYSASKMAVISLTQSAALGLAPQGIRVNAIAPGGILTPMWDMVRALYRSSGTVDGDITEHLQTKIPLGRMSIPADHVGAAVFLACSESAYITGQTLNIDGGLFLN